jgi:hypothetical protein
MADSQHLEILGQGEPAWNEWRREHPEVVPDLTRGELQRRKLGGFDFSGADLSGAALMGAELRSARFVGATLDGVKINDARAPYVDFTDARLAGAYLWGSDFREAIFRHANLRAANLICAQLVGTDFRNADLTGCRVYGVSVWDVKVDGATQEGLHVAPPNRENAWDVRVGDLHVAQLIYLLLSHDKLRVVMNAVADRGVLILGRFGGGGKDVLEAVAAKLRELRYLPIIFDFPPQQNRTLTETVRTLASLSRFVIVDLSGPSIPHELAATVPDLDVPFIPILESGRDAWATVHDFDKYEWFLPPVSYANTKALTDMLRAQIVSRAEQRIEKKRSRLRPALALGDAEPPRASS